MTAPWPGPFGPPPDVPAVVACSLAAFCAVQGRPLFSLLFRARRSIVLTMLAGAALALSAGYVAFYLRGGPRIIDATSYYLEARALAGGHVTWPIDEPTSSVRGRFLLTSGPFEAPRIGVIFPPGYPVFLALGFLLHHPMWMGPLIAAALVLLTYRLALVVTGREDVARLAAVLSVLCAALRYHSADTMAHGWAALLLGASLLLAFESLGTNARTTASAIGSGACLGWLVATRPVSALSLLPVWILVVRRAKVSRSLAALAAAAVPVALFVIEQHAVTGHWLVSAQSAYYALADGPPDCFRYGFGAGIGCVHEHGEYVASVLPQGHGWTAAAVTTLRRLRLHSLDVANAEPLALLVFAAPWLAFRRGSPATSRLLALAGAVVSIVLAYVPFYFDGSYPGGGGRFFADVLPLEHVLVAAGAALVADRKLPAPRALARAAAIVAAISLVGFGVHAAYPHDALRDREGGRPLFLPEVARAAHVERGLLFVGTDHAFNLAYDPDAHDAERSVVVSREYGDDRDRQRWEKLGRPPAFRYVDQGERDRPPALALWSPPALSLPYRLEAEAEWPPLEQSGGYFEPVFATGTCAWGGRLLAIRSTRSEGFHGTISFPVSSPGRFSVAVHLAYRGSVKALFALKRRSGEPPLVTWGFAPPKRPFDCATLPEAQAILDERGILEVTVQGGADVELDAIALVPVGGSQVAR